MHWASFRPYSWNWRVVVARVAAAAHLGHLVLAGLLRRFHRRPRRVLAADAHADAALGVDLGVGHVDAVLAHALREREHLGLGVVAVAGPGPGPAAAAAAATRGERQRGGRDPGDRAACEQVLGEHGRRT
jgi:hypothetical protein